jgi:hypothetical protein
MFVRLEQAKAFSEIANKTAITLAVLVGGAWTFYKFVIQDSPTAQLAAAQVARICSERGSLDLKIDLDQRADVLLGRVEAKNIGTRQVKLDIEHPPIRVEHFMVDSDGTLKTLGKLNAEITILFPEREIDAKDQSLRIASILPGRTFEMPFVLPIKPAGLYLVRFEGGPRSIEPDDRLCAYIPNEPQHFHWAASKIHYFGPALSGSVK